MENMTTPTKAPDGLLKIGYVANLKGGVYIKELQELLSDTEHEPTSQEIRERADVAVPISLNRYGYPTDNTGQSIPERSVIFKGFNTGYKLDGQDVYGWYIRNDKENRFEGVIWLTIPELKAYARLKSKFKMGDFYFDSNARC